MRCKTVAQWLSEYVDGVLAADQVIELKQHLADCASCRQSLADLRQTLALVQELEEVAPPADLLQRIHTQIEAEATPVPGKADGRGFWCVLNTPVVRFAAAASLLALVSVHALRHRGTGSEIVAPARPAVLPAPGPSAVAPTVEPAVELIALEDAPSADEIDLPLVELEESRPDVAAKSKRSAPVAASLPSAKTIAPRRRKASAESDGAIWGGTADVSTEKAMDTSREISPALSAAPAAPGAFSSRAVPIEGRADMEEEVVAERASRMMLDDVAKEDQALRVETITVASTDLAAVRQLVARFAQGQKLGRSAGKSRAAASELPDTKLKGAVRGGAVVHASVPAASYEELVAALEALEQKPADEAPQTVVTVIVTIVQP